MGHVYKLPVYVTAVSGITCALSIIGAAAIIFSYLCFKNLRNRTREIIVHISLMDFRRGRLQLDRDSGRLHRQTLASLQRRGFRKENGIPTVKRPSGHQQSLHSSGRLCAVQYRVLHTLDHSHCCVLLPQDKRSMTPDWPSSLSTGSTSCAMDSLSS